MADFPYRIRTELIQGPPGAQGQGNFTLTTAAFVMPAQDGVTTVSIPVVNSAWAAIGGFVFIPGAGYFKVTGLPDTFHLTVVNPVGYVGNAAPGTNIPSPVAVVSAGPQGQPGQSAFTQTTAAFSMPTQNGVTTVTVAVANSQWLAIGGLVFIPVAGYMQVTGLPDATHMTVVNPVGYVGNAAPNTNIASGSSVQAAGVIGLQGPAGPTGSGTSIAAASSINTTGNVPNFGASPGIIREDIDMSAASQITRTLPTPANTPNGSVYWAKLINSVTTPTVKPVLFLPSGGMPLEDPNNPGGPLTSSAVSCAVQGASLAWQRNINTGWQLILFPQLPGVPL